MSRGRIDVARSEQRHGPDELIPLTTRFALGYQIGTQAEPIGPGGAFGHSGAGGSLGFADPEARIGFGYVMNRMENGLFLIGPTRDCVDERGYCERVSVRTVDRSESLDNPNDRGLAAQ